MSIEEPGFVADVKPGKVHQTIRGHVDALLRDLAYEEYRVRSGQKDESELGAVFGLHPAASELDSERELRHLLDREEDVERGSRLRLLLESVTLHRLDAGVAELSDALANDEARQRIDLPGGGTAAYRHGWMLLANEPDRGRRGALEAALLRAVAELNPRRAAIHLRTHELAAGSGRGLYARLVEEVSGLEAAPLAAGAAAFERETEDAYREHLDWSLRRELELPLGRAARHDLARLFRGCGHDASFPANRMLATVSGFLERLGIEPRAAGRIRLDAETRPRKNPCAFCVAPEIPGEVYLAVRPSDGAEAYAAFLHELGRALHLAHARADLPMERRRLGDASVPEAIALTFDHLLLSEAWLRRVAGMSRPEEFLRHAWLRELFLVRRHGAKLRYEMELHRDERTEGKAELYVHALTTATRVPYPAEAFLEDVDRHFFRARRMRARLLEAQLSDYLVRNHGEDWFVNPAAGRFLKDLWAGGQRWTAAELSALVGGPGLEFGALRDRILRKLA
ncbi:MAG: hypothetical protein HYZ53_02395 [Planctomycetes bacterium]|nr:hypothetical protein [Planctomycetota bacterium]